MMVSMSRTWRLLVMIESYHSSLILLECFSSISLVNRVHGLEYSLQFDFCLTNSIICHPSPCSWSDGYHILIRNFWTATILGCHLSVGRFEWINLSIGFDWVWYRLGASSHCQTDFLISKEPKVHHHPQVQLRPDQTLSALPWWNEAYSYHHKAIAYRSLSPSQSWLIITVTLQINQACSWIRAALILAIIPLTSSFVTWRSICLTSRRDGDFLVSAES